MVRRGITLCFSVLGDVNNLCEDVFIMPLLATWHAVIRKDVLAILKVAMHLGNKVVD